MPHNFFDLYGNEEIIDEEGADLPHLAAALSHAVENARDCAAHDVKSGKLDLSYRIEITSAEGQSLATVRFAEAITVAN